MASRSVTRTLLSFLSLTILLQVPAAQAYRMICQNPPSLEYGITTQDFTRYCANENLRGPGCRCNPRGLVECHGSATARRSRQMPGENDGTEQSLFDRVIGDPDRQMCLSQCQCHSRESQKARWMRRLRKLFRQPPPDQPLLKGQAVDRQLARQANLPPYCQKECTSFYDCEDIRTSISGCQEAICHLTPEKSAGLFFGMGNCVGLEALDLLGSGGNGKRSLITNGLTCPCNASFAANACCWERSGIVRSPGGLAVQLDDQHDAE